jgi:uncharacterized membrane protein YbaN (DUF454 family)
MSEQVKKNEKKIMKPWLRVLLIFLGVFFIGLATLGIFIPVLPTTPFLLLSAALFARSSDRFYRWLIENRFFGRYIKDYREGKGVPIKVKMGAIIILWVTICLSIVFGVEILWVRILLVVVAIGVTIHIAMIKNPK